MSQPIDYDRLAADYACHRGLHPGVLARLLKYGRLTADAQVLIAQYLFNILTKHRGCGILLPA